MAWVERGNPVTQNPETNTVLRAFRSLDFRVVVEQFMTDTAREADIVLPAKTMFEQSDVTWAYWHPYIQLKQKVLEPPGEVKPETEVYWHLARQLGLPEAVVRERIPAPDDASIDSYLERRLAPFSEITLAALKENPILAPGYEEVAFSERAFPTPSGKIELLSLQAQEWWGVAPLPEFVESAESVRRESDGSRRFPLYFMTPNTKNRIHSQFNNLRMIREVSPGPFALISPADAKARGISAGDTVRIFNDRGEMKTEARIDYGMKAGLVSVTNGWWISEGGTVNFCSLGRETDMGHGAAFHDNLVQVERDA